MKINIMFGNADELSSHTNYNPFETGKLVWTLDGICDNGEVDEIIAIDCVDYIDSNLASDVVANWIGKLAHGGKLIVGGTDLYEISRSFSSYKVPLDFVNTMLHGSQQNALLFKKAVYTGAAMAEYLKSHGLKIMKQRINEF